MKKVLIIGAGGIARRHIRGFLKTERAALSIVEPDNAKRADVAQTYPIDQSFAHIGEVDVAAYDLGVICAPAHVHMPLGQTCADAGVPFILEKPLAVTMNGVDHLIATVARQGLTARVGYIRRSSPEIIQLREDIANGRIGRLRLCYINMSQEFPKYRPDFQTTYYARPETGGGAILDGASHMIDLLLWTIGEITEVAAMYDQLELPGVEVEDTALISLRFKDGAMAQINMNQFQKPNVATIEMIGTEGNLVLDSATTALRFANDDSGQWESIEFMDGMGPMEAHEARFALQANCFLDALEGKPCHLATLEEARANLAVALAAKESYRTKRIISLP